MTETKTKPESKKEKVNGSKVELTPDDYGSGPFQFTLENVKVLKKIVETLSAIIDETTFYINEDKFTVKAMDPSKICLLQLEIDKEDFDEFECATPAKVSLNLDDLDKIMKRASSDDSITILHEAESNKIKIKMLRTEQERTRSFSLNLLDIDIEDISFGNLLNISYTSSWKTDPDFLMEALKDAEIYSEIIHIKAKENTGLTYTSSGQIGEMKYEIGLDEFIETNIESKETGSYSIIFLKAILKIAPITETLKVSLKTDHPIKMVFNLLEGGKLNYFLAPRVDTNESNEDDEDTYLEEPEEMA